MSVCPSVCVFLMQFIVILCGVHSNNKINISNKIAEVTKIANSDSMKYHIYRK